MSTVQSLVTADEFMRMSLDNPVELVEGEVAPVPPPDHIHGNVCFRVIAALSRWYFGIGGQAGEISTNDAGVLTRQDPDTVRGADVCYFSADRIPGRKLRRRQVDLIPNLCVEVMSEFDRWREVHHKIDEYLERGVNEVWIVDPEKRHVQVFRAEESPMTFTEGSELTSDQLPGFSCQIAEFFIGV